MAKKITQEQIDKMLILYSQIGTYSGVAKELGIAASTVSKYIKAAQETARENPTIDFPIIEPLPIEQISFESVINFSFLTEEEKDSYNTWLKEFNRV